MLYSLPLVSSQDQALQADAASVATTALDDYMREHAYEEEAALWDWCPVWHAITRLEEIRTSLPPLPFKHDGEWDYIPHTKHISSVLSSALTYGVLLAGTKAEAVQSLLVSRRVPRVDPTPFVRVLRLVFDNVYGQFRTLSCLTFGLYKDLVAILCSGEFQFRNSLSRFVVRGRFIFAQMPPGSREKLE